MTKYGLLIVTASAAVLFIAPAPKTIIAKFAPKAAALETPNVDRIRFGGMLVASLITSVSVAFLGVIGFIGLIAPQIVRRLIGGDQRFLLPISTLVGALILLISDTVARTLISPIILPVGAITSFFGAPLFLYMLLRGNKKR